MVHKRFFITLWFCLIFCTPLITAVSCTTLDAVRTQNRERLNKLEVGMFKQKVLEIMGTETIKTYVTSGWSWLLLRPNVPSGTINNPYRSETYNTDKGTLEVLYYYTDEKAADGAVTDDELTPIVFKEGVLIGWGWGAIEDVEEKYEIRIR